MMYETIPHMSQILFKFRLVNISTQMLDSLELHLELGADMVAVPYA